MAGFVQNVGFQHPELEAINRRMRLAEALQAQSQEPIQSAAPNAPISWTQGLAKMMQAYNARRGMDKAEQQRQAFVQQTESRRSADAALLAQALQGRQAQSAGPYEDAAGNITQMPATQAQSPMQSLGQAIPLMGPEMQGPALQLMSGAQQREDTQRFQAEQASENRAARLQERLLAITAAQAQAGQNEQMRRDLAQQANDVRMQIAQMSQQSQANRPPPGYRPTPQGNLEAIPGGPADMKIQGQFNADTGMLNNSVSDMDRLATAANELLQHKGLGGITGLRGAIPNVPGSAAADAQAKLDTLKSQVGFGVLQNMRNNSKTGGALGQVSDTENKLLQANLAALANAQSEEQMRESLQKIISYTEGAKDRLRSAFNMKHGNQMQQPQQAPYTGPERRSAPSGFSIVR